MFRNQILEDIRIIQNDFASNNPLLEKEEYAFNYWVLSRLFNIDEEVIDGFITEYCDDGIDCFAFFEDSKELYIIQNKFYSDSTFLSKKYVQNDFLLRPLETLANNNYKRSEELQKIFNKYKNDSELNIFIQLFVANNNRDKSINEMINRYQKKEQSIAGYVTAQIYYLDDIEKLYYGERKEKSKKFKGNFYSKNEGTVLNIDRKNYDLPNLIDAKYLLMPVVKIYELVKNAKAKDYSLFSDNIRDYLGKNKINAKIAATLKSDEDRSNFFYYNNGITVICDSIKKEHNNEIGLNLRLVTENPQIVNGCQTVNTIYEVLDNYSAEELTKHFSETFVMVKILQLDSNNDEHKDLYEAIVRYNNSQNAISEKQFAANQSIFKNIQIEFEKRGFLLAVKQSDKNIFKSTKNFNDYRPKLEKYSDLFGVTFKNINDIIIPLEKFLQVIIAFFKDGYYAYVKKGEILKQESHTYEDVIKILGSNGLTIDNLIYLYLLFLKADKEKTSSEDKRTPIPLYLIGFLGRKAKYAEDINQKKAIDFLFSSKKTLDDIYLFLKLSTGQYKTLFKSLKQIEYNQMIKTAIDEDVLTNALSGAKDMLKMISPCALDSLEHFENILK